MKMKLMIVIFVVACAGLMAACGSDNKTSTSAVCTSTTKVCLKSGTN